MLLLFVFGAGLVLYQARIDHGPRAIESWRQSPEFLERLMLAALSLMGIGGIGSIVSMGVQIAVVRGSKPLWLQRPVLGAVLIDRTIATGKESWWTVALPHGQVERYYVDESDGDLAQVGDTVHLHVIGANVVRVRVLSGTAAHEMKSVSGDSHLMDQFRSAGDALAPNTQPFVAWLGMLFLPLALGGICANSALILTTGEVALTMTRRLGRFSSEILGYQVITGLSATRPALIWLASSVIAFLMVLGFWWRGWDFRRR